jgi:hypothetical protein
MSTRVSCIRDKSSVPSFTHHGANSFLLLKVLPSPGVKYLSVICVCAGGPGAGAGGQTDQSHTAGRVLALPGPASPRPTLPLSHASTSGQPPSARG